MKYRFKCTACGRENACEIEVNTEDGRYLEYGPDLCPFSRNPGRESVTFEDLTDYVRR
jgi:hypothetical protein